MAAEALPGGGALENAASGLTVSEARVALARKSQSVENGCRGVARWGFFGECRLWTQDVSEARVAPARGRRDFRLYNRKLWRPTDAKNPVRSVSNPILFRRREGTDGGGTGVCRSEMGVRSFVITHPALPFHSSCRIVAAFG